MSLEAFRRTQEQFYFAVLHFPRPMAGLLARIPRPERRLGLLENLVEEHGNFEAAAFHEATFRAFLRSIGARHEAMEELPAWPAVAGFNALLSGACHVEPLEVGAGCLGIIEYAFADVSTIIGRGAVDRGWVEAGKLPHYRLHAEIDRQHAADLFEIVAASWPCPGRRREIVAGLELGAYAFDRLYRDLFRAACGHPGAASPP
jgi:pyrroloquinoline-quinone synthase